MQFIRCKEQDVYVPLILCPHGFTFRKFHCAKIGPGVFVVHRNVVMAPGQSGSVIVGSHEVNCKV